MRLLALILCLGCDQPNFVQLVPVELGDDPRTGSGGPAGFSCRTPCGDPTGRTCPLLFQRASDAVRPSPRGIGLAPDFAGPRAMGSAVVDFLTLSPGPSDSSPFVVIVRCTTGPCVPVVRQCFPIDLTSVRDAVDAEGAAARGSLLDTIFDQLHETGALISADAPDEELLVRMVTTTLTCEEIAKHPLRFSEWPADSPVVWGKSIFGCGYAGPLRLDSVHGGLFLGLPTLDAVNCVAQAAVCAADFDPRQSAALLGF